MKKILLFKEDGFYKIQTFNSFGHSYGTKSFATNEKRIEYLEEIKKHWDFSGHEYNIVEINEKNGITTTIERIKLTQNKVRFNLRLSLESVELLDLALENNLGKTKTEVFERALEAYLAKEMPLETFDILRKGSKL